MRGEQDARDVFVVYGRNGPARDAIFQFLESLQLRPLSWEAAGDLVQEGTPRTIESVTEGIRNAQAVVVLMSGDDLARLRNQLGFETARTQPRPNVLLETGLAIATHGLERVILVHHRMDREITDLAGLNYVELDNSVGARQALAGRLKRAGCRIRDFGDRHLSPSTGGDFDASMVFDDAHPARDRGGFDENIVDSTISYRTSNIRLLRELENQLRNPGASDLKFNYLGVAGASNWIKLTEESAYAGSGVKDLMATAIPRFLRAAKLDGKDIDLISLGPGDGELDARILREAKPVCSVRHYYPIDISIELLQQTVERTTKLCLASGTRVKAILGDFLELRNYKPIYGYDDALNVVALLGFTFGNYDERMLLSRLRDALNPGDLIIIDARLHDLGSAVSTAILKTHSDELVPRFRHAANNRFAFGPVEMATVAEYSSAKIEQRLSMTETAVDGAFNVITYCRDLDTRFRGGGRIQHRRLDLAVSTFYDLDGLEEFIIEKEFEIVDRVRKGDLAALLLRRP